MGYRVRTPDGELNYATLLDVEVAYTQGLVDPEDEVLEDGHTTWRKAASIPALARSRAPSRSFAARAPMLSVMGAVLLGLCALLLIASDSWPRRGLGIALALVMSTVLTRVTYKAFKRPGARRG